METKWYHGVKWTAYKSDSGYYNKPKDSLDSWEIEGDGPYNYTLAVLVTDVHTQDEIDRHAALIASAPETATQRDELLEALNLILPLAKGYLDTHRVGCNESFIRQADAAIARATGASS